MKMRPYRLFALVTLVATSAVGLFGACGGKSASQLILVVQSDMAIPKDVTHVRIEVLSAGAVQFSNEYEVGAGGTKIPATLGILPGKDPRAPVTIRVIAKRGGKVRTLREVVTTIPDRTAQLRMPIQWLCTDKVNDKGESTCPVNESCLNGICQPNEVADSALPQHLDEDIFGGASGSAPEKGKCFDVSACFRGAIEVPLTLNGCTIPSGGFDSAQANVAVRPATGEGICDAEGNCFVPLDGDSTEKTWAGAQASPQSSTFALGDGLCRRIVDERGRQASPKIFLSGACPVKKVSIPNCGPWSATSAAIVPAAPVNPAQSDTRLVLKCTQTGPKCDLHPVAGQGDVCCLHAGQNFACQPASACQSDGGALRPVKRDCDTVDDCASPAKPRDVCCEGAKGSRCVAAVGSAKAECADDEGEPCNPTEPVCSEGKTCKECEYRNFGVPPWKSAICARNGVCPVAPAPDGG